MAENEFNVLSIINSMQKLKATVGALVQLRKDNEEVLFEAKKNYFSNIMIYTDSEEEKQLIRTNKFRQFIDCDYRKTL